MCFSFLVFICKYAFKVYPIIITRSYLSKVRGAVTCSLSLQACCMLAPTQTLILEVHSLNQLSCQTLEAYCLVYYWSNHLLNIICVCPFSFSVSKNPTNYFCKTKKGKLRNLKRISQPQITFYTYFESKLFILSFSSGIKYVVELLYYILFNN